MGCSLPDLPDEREDHSMSGLTICGGWYTKTSCLVFSQGEWSAGPAMAQERTGHCSWVTQEGTTLLMGGAYLKGWTTELVGQGAAFYLEYDTV